jgi:hypothetical protein
MGNRFVKDRIKKAGVTFSQMWVAAHMGRYWKRAMSKARRRAWKQRGIEGTPVNRYENDCAYKGW